MSTSVVEILDNSILRISFVQETHKIFQSAYIFELFCDTLIIAPFTYTNKYFCADNHCVKSVRIWSYSGLHFSAFGLYLSVFIPNAGECGPE